MKERIIGLARPVYCVQNFDPLCIRNISQVIRLNLLPHLMAFAHLCQELGASKPCHVVGCGPDCVHGSDVVQVANLRKTSRSAKFGCTSAFTRIGKDSRARASFDAVAKSLAALSNVHRHSIRTN